LDQLIRSIQVKVYEEHQVILTAIGVYSVNTKDDEIRAAYKKVKDAVLSHKYIRQMHGFYMDKEKKTLRFDIVVSFDAEDRRAVYEKVLEDVGKIYPGYELQVAMDTDFSEE
ncbi:MAG: cation transporter, partial [Lachnospiraceae bacterium]|nr:cation transporter [Lachnospiraceae bacterium]